VVKGYDKGSLQSRVFGKGKTQSYIPLPVIQGKGPQVLAAVGRPLKCTMTLEDCHNPATRREIPQQEFSVTAEGAQCPFGHGQQKAYRAKSDQERILNLLVGYRNIFLREIYEWRNCNFHSEDYLAYFGTIEERNTDLRFERLTRSIEGLEATVIAAWRSCRGGFLGEQTFRESFRKYAIKDKLVSDLEEICNIDRTFIADSEAF